MGNDTFVYRIDESDTIISVSNNWSDFANENAWHGQVQPEEVVGHSLWDFIQDFETRHLYQELFRHARQGKPSRAIPFRCDSPGERRYLHLLVKALDNNHIEITSKICQTESRTPLRLLDPEAPRSSDIVTICSMCKKLKISSEEWVDLEDGLTRLKLFEADKMPQLSHGLCLDCYHAVMIDIEDMREKRRLRSSGGPSATL